MFHTTFDYYFGQNISVLIWYQYHFQSIGIILVFYLYTTLMSKFPHANSQNIVFS